MPQVQRLQEQASQLPHAQQELQEVLAQVQQLQDAVQQVAALKAQVAELQQQVSTAHINNSAGDGCWGLVEEVCARHAMRHTDTARHWCKYRRVVFLTLCFCLIAPRDRLSAVCSQGSSVAASITALFTAVVFLPAVCAQAAECELLNEQQEQLQGVSLEAEQLREQVQQLRQATADHPALRDELQELQVLLTNRQQLQQEAQDADQLRQQVQALREAQVDLAALREELQQLQATHDEAIMHVQELKLKVGGV